MAIEDEFEQILRTVENDKTEKIKVAFFGQPGAGKSSLMNGIVGRPVAQTSQKTDTTQEAQIIEHNDLLLVDLPGYGTSKFPRNEYFQDFRPEQYELFLCIFSGKFNKNDTDFFRKLKEAGRICLFVRTKADEIWDDGKSDQESRQDIKIDVKKQVNDETVQVYFTSCKNHNEGIAKLIDAIGENITPAKYDKFYCSVATLCDKHLEIKKDVCKRLTTQYAALAATNALNPIPVADVSIDIAIILKLFSKIRDCFGLDDEEIKKMTPLLPLPLINNILTYATKEGLMVLLKKYSTKAVAKEFAKYIPFVGPVIAGSIGFAITKLAGNEYLDNCYKVAELILKQKTDEDRSNRQGKAC